MQKLKSTDASGVIARLVRELALERDPARMVRNALDMVRTALGAEWSIAQATGDGGLANLNIAHACESSDQLLTVLPFGKEPNDERLRVVISETMAGFCLWLPQHTQLRVAMGPVQGESSEAWRSTLHELASYLLTRLHETLELHRAQLANTALERRVSDLSLLFKGLDVTLSSVELTKVLRAFLTCVTSGEAIGFNRAFLLLLDEEQNVLRGKVAVGPASGEEARAIWKTLDEERASLEEILRRAMLEPNTTPKPGSLADRIRNYTLPLDPESSILARAATSSGMYNIHIYKGEAPEPFADEFGAREFVVIPIQGRERTLGVIVADSLYAGKPMETDRVFLLSGLANHVGVVIENALMFEDVSKRWAELNEVQYINRALLSSTDEVEILRQIAQNSASMMQATGTLLFVCEGDPPQPRLEMQVTSMGPPLSEGAVERCAAIAHETLDQRSSVMESYLDGNGGDSELGVTANVISAPMSIDNEVVGVLVVYRVVRDEAKATRFDRHSKRFLSIIADQAAIAILSGRRMKTIRDDQQQIEQLNHLLYRNEKLAALGQASSQIAHEIRNPLTALGGFARRLLRSKNLLGPDREAAEVIVRETARLERILNDQLAFVRSARLQRTLLQLNDLAGESCTLLRHLIQSRGVEIELQLDPELPEAALDGDRIKQVLVNLLMNAIAAVDEKGRIRLATRAAGPAVEIEVANTGPAIPEEVSRTLFMPFATTRQEGTGLGLAVVDQIVTEHEGRIRVHSDELWGTVFQIALPIGEGKHAQG